eukprot:726599-Prymnesium_polylepis.4
MMNAKKLPRPQHMQRRPPELFPALPPPKHSSHSSPQSCSKEGVPASGVRVRQHGRVGSHAAHGGSKRAHPHIGNRDRSGEPGERGGGGFAVLHRAKLSQ